MLCNRAPVYSRSPPSNDRNRNTRVTHFNETNRVSHFNETTRTKDEYTSVNKTRRNEPSIELMERLGRGIKPEVTKKEMYEITRRGVKKLPENRKKDTEVEKKRLLQERKEKLK